MQRHAAERAEWVPEPVNNVTEVVARVRWEEDEIQRVGRALVWARLANPQLAQQPLLDAAQKMALQEGRRRKILAFNVVPEVMKAYEAAVEELKKLHEKSLQPPPPAPPPPPTFPDLAKTQPLSVLLTTAFARMGGDVASTHTRTANVEKAVAGLATTVNDLAESLRQLREDLTQPEEPPTPPSATAPAPAQEPPKAPEPPPQRMFRILVVGLNGVQVTEVNRAFVGRAEVQHIPQDRAGNGVSFPHADFTAIMAKFVGKQWAVQATAQLDKDKVLIHRGGVSELIRHLNEVVPEVKRV